MGEGRQGEVTIGPPQVRRQAWQRGWAMPPSRSGAALEERADYHRQA